ncbi:hypothetical protein KCU68_g56, partial [Aureobasidium melanogenum]
LSTESLADSTSCRFFSVEGAIRKPVRKFPRRKHEQMVHTRLDELETAVGRGTLYQCRVTTARLAPRLGSSRAPVSDLRSLTFHADISGTAYLAPIQPRLGPPHADASLRRLRRYQPNAPEWSIKTRDATTACWPGEYRGTTGQRRRLRLSGVLGFLFREPYLIVTIHHILLCVAFSSSRSASDIGPA